MQNKKTRAHAQDVNRKCLCKTLDKDRLFLELARELGGESILNSRPHLFSHTSLYMAFEDLVKIKKVIAAVEEILALDKFQHLVLSSANAVASKTMGPAGVCMGYDFHLTVDGPKLIEINTNAGGALLNLILARAQVACCEGVELPYDLAGLEKKIIEMFFQEWRFQKGNEDLRVMAIVDEKPSEQYLYPEFQLFAKLFKKFGLDCLILDPKDLTVTDSGLYHQDTKIDLVYNRLTDFYFELPESAALKEAYLNNKVVVTPNPHHHTLYANKLNLEVLTDGARLREMGVSEEMIETLLSGIPKTLKLTENNKAFLWANRKRYFFKPATGYGSKAAYRGDKLTHRVWEEINQGLYVAQEIAPPGLRMVKVGEEESELKQDLRAYTYQGHVQLLAARLYAGQTTNFRTLGGGFAPVFLV